MSRAGGAKQKDAVLQLSIAGSFESPEIWLRAGWVGMDARISVVRDGHTSNRLDFCPTFPMPT